MSTVPSGFWETGKEIDRVPSQWGEISRVTDAIHSHAFNELVARFRAGELTPRHNVLAVPMEAPHPGDISRLPEPGSTEYHQARRLGEAAIARGEIGVVILAGGMATRFGYEHPKALFPIHDGKSFLNLKLDAVRAVGHTVPVFIMTSFATDAGIKRHLIDNDHFGHAKSNVQCFEQDRLPRVDQEGNVFYRQAKIDYCASGHGDFPFVFRRTGLLDGFIARGGRFLLFSNVDNLGATIDPVIIGHHIKSGKQMTVEVAAKNPGDQGGAPARVNDRLQLVEGFAFPSDFDQSAITVFNTANYVFSADALHHTYPLPWYVVEKSVEGQRVTQFERLAGDLSAFMDCIFIEVERNSRFWPVKSPQDVPTAQHILNQHWNQTLASLKVPAIPTGSP